MNYPPRLTELLLPHIDSLLVLNLALHSWPKRAYTYRPLRLEKFILVRERCEATGMYIRRTGGFSGAAICHIQMEAALFLE